MILTACFEGEPAIEMTDEFMTEQAIDKTNPDWKTQFIRPS